MILTGWWLWDFTSRSSIFPVTMIFMLVSICWAQNSQVLVEKLGCQPFDRCYSMQVLFFGSHTCRGEWNQNSLCKYVFSCVDLLELPNDLIFFPQNCISMFFCHIAIWVVHMEHAPLAPFRRTIESFCVSAEFFKMKLIS